jgi:hypothetical protein
MVMCDCKKSIEKRILDKFKEQYPGDDHRVELAGDGLVMIELDMKQKGYMPIEASYMHTFKNGSTKRKSIRQNMFFNYCPFCGEKST